MGTNRRASFLGLVFLWCLLVAFKLGQVYVETRGSNRTNKYKNVVSSAQHVIQESDTWMKDHKCDSVCNVEFIKYIPSALEQIWSAEIKHVESNEKTWKVGCELLNLHLPQIQEMLAAVRRYTSDQSLVNLASSNMSALEFRNSCTGVHSLVHIEPLISFLRHPLALCPKTDLAAHVLDKTYLFIPHSDEVTHDAATKWLFDAGASTYNKGAGGASQSWFVDTYRARGVEFDRIIGWEAAKTDPSNQWDDMPADIKRKTSWFNVPVNTGAGVADNPLTFIKHLTKPEDFVVFKLDIDSPLVEIALVQQLMADPQILGLVDEFYFEHHVSGSPMQWLGWGDLQNSDAELSTLKESYELFTFLREHGVRAHSWV